jgi:hypothetical protein
MGRLDPFDSAIKSWDSYHEHVEQLLFICNEVKTRNKIRFIHIEWWKHIRCCADSRLKKPTEASYKESVATLQSRLFPKPLVISAVTAKSSSRQTTSRSHWFCENENLHKNSHLVVRD